MLPIIVFALLVLLLFGFGFSLHLLWIIAIVALAIWLLGFLVRPGAGTGRGRWYYW
jgi:hypothetical protein